MRMGTWGKPLQGQNGRIQPKSRLKELRKGRTRWVELEGLEARTLLSTLPAATTTAAPVDLTGLGSVATQGNADSPTVEIDPADPTKMISTWVVNNPSIPPNGPYVNVDGAYSIDSGKDWLSFSAEVVLLDPATTNPTIPYADITNPTVAFDDVGDFYILVDEHNAGYSSGSIALEKYTFTGDAPVQGTFNTPTGGQFFGGASNVNILDQWLPGGDEAAYPTMAVDSNPVTPYKDPVTGVIQSDPYSGNIYVAWSAGAVPPAGNPLGAYFNPYATILVASSDGGNSFSAQTPINSAGYGPTTERDTNPQITISQGRPAGESGNTGDPGIAPGTVTVGWADYGSLAKASPPQSLLLDNTVTPGRNYTSTQILGLPSGIITPGTKTAASITAFDLNVSVPANQIANLNALTLSVAITDANDANLGLILIAPDNQKYTVFVPQTINGATNTVRRDQRRQRRRQQRLRGRDHVQRQRGPQHRGHQPVHRGSRRRGTVRRRLPTGGGRRHGRRDLGHPGQHPDRDAR